MLEHVADCAKRQCAVRAGQRLELGRAPQAGAGFARVNVDEFDAPGFGLLQPAGIGRVQIVDVCSPQNHGMRVADFIDRGGAVARAHQRGQHVGGRAGAGFSGRHHMDAPGQMQGHFRGQFAFPAVPQRHGQSHAVARLVTVFVQAFPDLGRGNPHGFLIADAFPAPVGLAQHGFSQAEGAVDEFNNGKALGAHGTACPAVVLFPDEAFHHVVAYLGLIGAAGLTEGTEPLDEGDGGKLPGFSPAGKGAHAERASGCARHDRRASGEQRAAEPEEVSA